MSKLFEGTKYEFYDNLYYRRIPRENDGGAISPLEMRTEFLEVLEDITGDINLENYSPYVEFGNSRSEEEECQKCICSHTITNLHYIRYGETGAIIQVGSDCIKKLDQHLYKGLKNGVCKSCKKYIPDKRKDIYKEGYCSEVCKENEDRLRREYVCKHCKKYIPDKRKDIWKEGYCNERCKEYEEQLLREYEEHLKKKKKEIEKCDSCQDTGISYWADDIYGPCLECKDINELQEEKVNIVRPKNICKCGKHTKGVNPRTGSYYDVCFQCFSERTKDLTRSCRKCNMKIREPYILCYRCNKDAR